MSRRFALPCLWLALSTLAGCSALGGSVADTVRLAVAQHSSQLPSAAEVAAKPYYQMYASTRSGQAVLILGNLDGEREAWYGKGDVVLFLRHGQVVASSGLASNLEGLRLPADNSFARGLQHLATPVEFNANMDWSGYRYGVAVHVRLVPMGATRLEILGQSRDVLRVDEILDAPAARWHAVNRYWVDPASGLVWKSEQHLTPEQAITLVQLKPYAGVQP